MAIIYIKPCRVCKETPDAGYPPSRAYKRDWICNTCSNARRAIWWAKAQIKRRQLKDTPKYMSLEETVARGLDYVTLLETTPNCPFCREAMRPNRSSKELGTPLNWVCSPCNEIIIGRRL